MFVLIANTYINKNHVVNFLDNGEDGCAIWFINGNYILLKITAKEVAKILNNA